VPPVAYGASVALCITDWAGVQHRPQPKPALTDFGLQPTALVCRFNGLLPHKYMYYYSYGNPRGMEGWVCIALVGWPIVDSLPTKWPPMQRGCRAGKICGQKADTLTTAPFCHHWRSWLVLDNRWRNPAVIEGFQECCLMNHRLELSQDVAGFSFQNKIRNKLMFMQWRKYVQQIYRVAQKVSPYVVVSEVHYNWPLELDFSSYFSVE